MFNSDDCIGVLGRRGTGKTFLSRQIQNAYPRKIIFDVLHDPVYANVPNQLYGFEEYCNFILKTENASSFEVVVNFDVENADNSDVFNEMLRIAYYRGSVLIVIEEVQSFTSAHLMPKWLQECFFTGRHRDIALIFTTQRPARCHKDMLSQCHHIFCGKLHTRADIDHVSNFLGNSADDITMLNDREFLYWNGSEISKINNSLQKL